MVPLFFKLEVFCIPIWLNAVNLSIAGQYSKGILISLYYPNRGVY